MANNFRKTGTYYISKAGDNLNNGTSPDTPKKTIADYGNADHVIGSGVYEQAVSIGFVGSYDMIFDGLTILIGDGTNEFIFVGSGNDTPKSRLNPVGEHWLILKNYSLIRIDMNQNGGISQDIFNIRFESPTQIRGIGNNLKSTTAINCIFTNTVTFVESSSNAYHTTAIRDSFFFDTVTCSGVDERINVQDSYFSPSSNLVLNISQADYAKTSFRNNNVRGTITISGNSYAIQDQFSGTPQDNGYAVGVEWLTEANLIANGYTNATGWDAAVATSINRDPLFNNVNLYDFTVSPSSPMIGAGVNSENIGGVEIGTTYLLADSSLTVSSSTDITITSGVSTITASATTGEIIFNPIQVAGGNKATIEDISYLGGLTFNSDITGGTSGNENVPDSQNYSAGDAGQNPNRLSYQMRWSTVEGASAPANWNNGSLVAQDAWSDIEIGVRPQIDGNGLGTGDKGFNSGNAGDIEASYIQFKVILRNDYASS